VLFIGCPFISPDFNSLNSSYRLGAAYGYGYLFRVMVRDRAMDRDRVRIQIQQVEIRQNEKEPFIVIAYCSLMILTVMWLGFFHINASSRLFNVKLPTVRFKVRDTVRVRDRVSDIL